MVKATENKKRAAVKATKGFKKSEVGLIPEDWKVKAIYHVADVNQNGGKSIPNEFVYIDLESVSQGRLVKKNTISRANAPSRAQRIVLENDILFQTVRPYQRNNLLFKEQGNFVASTGYAVLRSKIYPGYLYAQVHTDWFVSMVVDLSTGTSYPAIKPSILSKIKIPLPPTNAEQTAIATALGDMDTLIEAQEKLLAKKRLIKQGAMQELLRPKEGWEKSLLPEVVWFQEGPGVRKHQFTFFGVKLLNGTNIEKGKLLLDKTDRFISKHEAYHGYSHFLVDDGDILIACSGISVDKFHEKVTVAKASHLPLCMNTSTMRFKITSDKIDKAYFYHFLKTNSFKEQIAEQITGSAQLNFGPAHVKWVEIKYPQITEQQEIAAVLSDMDSDIEQLEVQLEKYKQLKTGMMQDLLTGRKRLDLDWAGLEDGPDYSAD